MCVCVRIAMNMCHEHILLINMYSNMCNMYSQKKGAMRHICVACYSSNCPMDGSSWTVRVTSKDRLGHPNHAMNDQGPPPCDALFLGRFLSR